MSDIKTAEKYNLEASVGYADGAVVSKTIIKKDAGNLTLFAFDQGQELSEHTAPFDALVQVIDGKAEIIINKQPHTLTTGEFIILPANVPHALKAVEKFKMLLVMVKA